MLVLREPADLAQVADGVLRHLIEERIREISDGGPWDSALYGYFIVVEAGDSVAALESQSGCSILSGRFNAACFGEAGFMPSFECIEKHPHCYEAVWVLSDDGFGVVIFIPKMAGIDHELLKMCKTYAVPENLAGPDTGTSNSV